MRPTEALAALSQMGLTLKPRPDGKLWVTPRDRITEQARTLIQEHKAGLLDILSAPPAMAASRRARPPIADRLADYHERLAICRADAVPRDQACAIAADQVGATLDQLAAEQVAEWHALIAALPAPEDAALGSLRHGLANICAEPWLLDAAALEWDAAALFGLHPDAPFVRSEAQGIACGLVLSPHNRTDSSGRRLRCHVVKVTATAATTETPSKARFLTYRYTPPAAGSVPLWELPQFRPPTRH